MVPLILIAAEFDGFDRCAGDGVVARPQPAQFRLRIALVHAVVHVVTENLPLVVELVVDADDVVTHVDRVGHVGDQLDRRRCSALGTMPVFRYSTAFGSKS